jgi:hypothetical protein
VPEKLPTPADFEALESLDAPESSETRFVSAPIQPPKPPIRVATKGQNPVLVESTPTSLPTVTPKSAASASAEAKAPHRNRRGRKKGSGRVVQTRAAAESLKLPTLASIKLASVYLHMPSDLFTVCKGKLCPAFDPSGRVDTDTLLAWLFKEGVVIFPKDAGVETEQLSYPQRDKRAVALTREYNLELLQKKHIDRNLVQSVLAKGMGMVFDKIDRQFGLELPAALKGLTEADIQTRLLLAANQFKEALRLELTKLSTEEVDVDNQNKPSTPK